ncbi:MAG: beta-propeller domain-containing protein [Zoogloeaceae bacterium]|jgi:hypothetical protein|nr:beta-propeller domain-containing protein [Zoogloeaceae bacterium]
MARSSLAFGIMGGFVLLGLMVTFFASPSVTPPPISSIGGEAGKRLQAFRSEAELHAWLQAKKKAYDAVSGDYEDSDRAVAAKVLAPQQESVTNTQSAGVDEGGIVKLHKEHLVILRRGRLFTVRIGDDALNPVDMQDAFAPNSDGRGGWYDELLISGETVVVIGYSYAKGGTELVLFRIGDDGKLTYQSTYILRSNDYYSSRNYASRLIGNTLIFYAPLYLNFYSDPMQSLPALRRWQDKQESAEFRRIAPATRIYRTTDDLDPRHEDIALHTVTACEIADGTLNCSASAILGYAGREFYVARNAVYIWTAPWRRGDTGKEPVGASVFRLPLTHEAAPTALKVLGSPIDQFSFLESEDAHLNVLLRADGPLASMWSAEEQGGQNLAFLRVPLAAFGDGADSAAKESYTPLVAPENGGSLRNRYIGDVLVYGAGQTWWGRKAQTAPSAAYVFHWKSQHVEGAPAPLQKIPLPHSVDRIEALGEMPLLVGTKNTDLYFTPLLAASPHAFNHVSWVGDSFKLPNAAQGEIRSHGFFYKPDATGGLLGLPFTGGDAQGWRQLRQTSSGVVFLRYTPPGTRSVLTGKLSELGSLAAKDKGETNDHCVASCMDWYGNSRPLFIANRLFALMGYEIVEGRIENNRLREIRRIDFYQEPLFPQARR